MPNETLADIKELPLDAPVKQAEKAEDDKVPMKTEDGHAYPREAFVVNKGDNVGDWKLRIWDDSDQITKAQLGAAAAALSPGGFRGQRVQLTDEEEAAAKRHIRTEYGKLGVEDDDIPDSVKELATKEGKRMMGRMKAKLADMLAMMKDIVKWASYDDMEDDMGKAAKAEMDMAKLMKMHGGGKSDEDVVAAAVDMGMSEDKAKAMVAKWAEIGKKDLAAGFKVYCAKEGKLRWLSRSTTAFKDKEGEIFRTKALENAVEQAEQRGDKGPLMLWHIKGTEIGRCDFQAVIGRFLVESGSFDDTPQAEKAIKFFSENGDTPYEMSVGYQYKTTDRADAVYDWLRILERSVCPPGVAANPWTGITIKEVEPMALNETKKAFLEGVFGAEFVADLAKKAEQDSKDLEKKVDFKAEGEGNEPFDMKALAETMAEAMQPVITGLQSVGEKAASIEAELIATKERLDKIETERKAEAEKAANAPRFAGYMHQRASSSGPTMSQEEAEKAGVTGPLGLENPNHPLNQRVGVSR